MPKTTCHASKTPVRRELRTSLSSPQITKELTIKELLEYLSPALLQDVGSCLWPPDIFAACSLLLQKSGGYILLVSDWPPRPAYVKKPKRWIRDVKIIAGKWRRAWIGSKLPPVEILGWWKYVLDRQSLPVSEIAKNYELSCALLQLSATADEAANGVGVPSLARSKNPLEEFVRTYVEQQRKGGSTLCKLIDKSKLRVLPKLHVPQKGMTIRSISHHLAVCPSGDVETNWFWSPNTPRAHCLNLLLLPWPSVTTPSHFGMSRGTLRNMPRNFGFFTYDPPAEQTAKLQKKTLELIDRAKTCVGPIDGVILPELALSPYEHGALRNAVTKSGAFLLSGVRKSEGPKKPGRNYLSLTVPLPGNLYQSSYEQDKHHRWLLDKPQIVQYGLGGTLDPKRSWWEYMSLEPRKLSFFAMRPWLTLCTLICEDLSRQDPVTEIVRAVGPNLVIALLMDGPQLPARWSARYATVLADDPGSSVLTLTSIGMAQLCRPPYIQGAKSRVIGLWKDAISGGPIPIEMPQGAEAVVLSLVAEYREEWSADGRSDRGATGYPVFGGAHPLF